MVPCPMDRSLRIGLVVYGSIEKVSGGYLYDRMLAERLESGGDRVEVISLTRRGYYRDAVRTAVSEMRDRYPGGERPDVVIVDELCHPSWSLRCRRLAAFLDRPVVALVHHLRLSEDVGPLDRAAAEFMETRFLRSVSGIIVNSSSTKREVEKLLTEGRSVPMVIAPPAGNRLPAGPVVPRTLGPEEPLRLLFVGNLIPRKGLHTLVRALCAAARRAGAGSFTLTVAGATDADPGYTRRIRGELRSIASLPEITLTGRVDDAALAALYGANHVVCVPSQFEGFGIVYLEGMHFGLPAVGASSGGASDIIRSGENGYLVPAEDPVALADILTGIRRDPEHYRRLSEGALRTAREFPSWDQSMDRIREFLREHFT